MLMRAHVAWEHMCTKCHHDRANLISCMQTLDDIRKGFSTMPNEMHLMAPPSTIDFVRPNQLELELWGDQT